ncbi:MAG: NAD-dependent succinate-semialdehyde dehydrogenase [Candidatus Dormibacterales bacterium]
MVPAGMPVGGRWVEAASGATMPVIDPGTEEVLAEVPDGTPADGALAMDAAAGAQATWAATGPRERGEILRRAFELMTERADELALLITLENGKPLSEARAEVLYAAEFFRWFGEEAVRVHGRYMRAPAGAARLLVAKQPVGPCLLITPWNFPAAMATRKIGPAVAAGCTMVLKPAGETPLTALATAALLEEAGLPGGVLSVVTTSRSGALTKPLFADPRLRKVSFTGSTEVGRLLLHHAADQVLRTSMELGGNAPFLVFEDADLDAAVGGALLAKMRNVGEACTSANRFYVAAPVAEEFAGRLGERMGDMRVGHGAEPGTEVGPLINEAGRAKVEELVTDMVSRGARVVVGGAPIEGRGYFYRPTVVADVAEGSRALSEEIFGPVAPVISFTDEASAVAWANRTEYGLVAYLYTRDVGRAFRVAEALEAGMVGLNTGLVSNPAAPFGGVKQSGLGREGGFEGVEEFLETKYISVNW